MASKLADEPPWGEAKWIAAAPDMTAPPFSDLGPQRVIKFAALGLRWTIHCRNERSDVLAAEAFAAALQVLLVDLAVRDPVFLPDDLDVEVRVREPGSHEMPAAQPRPGDRSGSRWRVYCPAAADGEHPKEHLQLLAALTEILMTHSLLPDEKFMTLLDDALEAGLTHKIEVGRPYQELADFHGPGHRSPARGIAGGPLGPGIPFPDRCAPELEPPTGPGPGYTRDKGVAAVRARYERLPPLLRCTLPRLLADAHARAAFAELRSQGWKDWHLLTALVNLVLNARVAAKYGQPTWEDADAYKESFQAEMNRPEQATDPPVPAGAVTREGLQDALNMSATMTVRNWGLQIHQPAVDPSALMRVLGDRYGYWSDDADHEDLFPC